MANQHKVPKSQWRKWSVNAQNLFNLMYYTLKHNQAIFEHPEAATSRKHWRTVSWNSAWVAADFIKELEKKAKQAVRQAGCG